MAVREEEDDAESLGINALTHKLLAFGVSAFFTGLAGGAFAYYHVSYYFQYPFTPIWSLDMLTMVYIGGTGTILGPIIGAVFFGVVKEFLVLNVGEYHLIIFGVLFILVVLFLPGGIVEAWERICKAFPQTTFWGYTRSWVIAELEAPLRRLRDQCNVQLFASVDSTMPMPSPEWRVAFITPDKRETGLLCRTQTRQCKNCLQCGYCFNTSKGNVIFKIH